VVAPPISWEQGGEQYISVVSGWGGAVPLWGGDVASKVNYLEQGGMVWVFKIPKTVAAAPAAVTTAKAAMVKVAEAR
jgi:alcohol dehydrogenase (cytochrome c)